MNTSNDLILIAIVIFRYNKLFVIYFLHGPNRWDPIVIWLAVLSSLSLTTQAGGLGFCQCLGSVVPTMATVVIRFKVSNLLGGSFLVPVVSYNLFCPTFGSILFLHYHSLLLLACVVFLAFSSCSLWASWILQFRRFRGKQAVPDFAYSWPPFWLATLITEISCNGFSGQNKKICKLTPLVGSWNEVSSKNSYPVPQSNWVWYLSIVIHSGHCFSLFIKLFFFSLNQTFFNLICEPHDKSPRRQSFQKGQMPNQTVAVKVVIVSLKQTWNCY